MGCAFSPAALADDGATWEWMVVPYGWGVSVGTDLEATGPLDGGLSNEMNFDDVLDRFDGAFQIHIEGQNDSWGMFTDFTYLGLADDRERPRFRTESDLDARLFEIAAVWNPESGKYDGLDLFAGLRYIDVDLTVRVEPNDPQLDGTTLDGSDSYTDLMIGARYTWPLSDRWHFTLRGDASFGDTEGTWNSSAVARLRTMHGSWLFGYRYLSVELEASTTRTDITMSGPMIGYGFIF